MNKWAASFCVCVIAGYTAPAVSDSVAVGSEEPGVTIYRDDWGVPHIYAAKEAAGFYGLGYAQAQDRLHELIGMAVWATGRRAEIQGKVHLPGDIERRRWRHAHEGSAGIKNLSPQLKENYRYFAAGINRYVAENPEMMPGWAPALTAELFVTISRAITWDGYHPVEGPRECQGAIGSPDLRSQQLEKGASNGWVVMPARTIDGATIVGADPHTNIQSPANYEYVMEAGDLKSAGYSLGPMMWQAHNRHVAWAMTTGNPDMWDCYEVNVDPENPMRFLYDGQWQDVETYTDVFHTLEGEQVTHTFEYTRHNGVLSPVIARYEDKMYVVSVSQMHDAGKLDEEIYRMNLASSVAEVKQAMSGLGMFPQNVMVGDNKGNALYVRAGKTPRRPAGFDWKRPVPGNSSATAWLGYHSLEEMILVENPVQGYMQNNNVAPDRLFGEGNINPSNYAPYLFNDTPGRITTRGMRAIEVLSTNSEFTREDAMALLFDEKWVTTEPWLRALRHVAEHYPGLTGGASENARRLIDRLLQFDGFARAESVAALNYFYWRKDMDEVLSRPEFETSRDFPWSESQFTESFSAALVEQAEKAAKNLIAELGSMDKPLGYVFRIGRGDQSWPVGGETISGGTNTDCIAMYRPLCDRTQRAFASAPIDESIQRRVYRGSQAMRLVILGDTTVSYTLHSYGQSSHEESPYWNDQARLASEHRLKSMFFDRQELDGHISSRLKLSISEDIRLTY